MSTNPIQSTICLSSCSPSEKTFSLVHPDPDKSMMAIRVQPKYLDVEGKCTRITISDIPSLDGHTLSPQKGDTQYERYILSMNKELPSTTFCRKCSDLFGRLTKDHAECLTQAEHTKDIAEISRCLQDGASAIQNALSEFPEFITLKFNEFVDAQGHLINNVHNATSLTINGSSRLSEQEKKDLVDRFAIALYADYESVLNRDGKSVYSLAHELEKDEERRNGWLEERRKYNDALKKTNSKGKSESEVSKSISQLDYKVKEIWGSYQSIPTNKSQWARLVDKSKSWTGWDLSTFEEFPHPPTTLPSHSGPRGLKFGFAHDPSLADAESV
ncbi:uncharacterized protein L199_007781 [Kwoniella botswanensis]|uniref:uncharacterized protein n=1 Tax=Kwoniella botswanensis TaxID=1268659 RepID=UPI00315C5233